MTNFLGTQTRKAPWFTPERLVLVLPVAGGAVVAVLLLVLALPPLLLQVQQRRLAILTLEAQQAELPQLRLRLVDGQVQVQRKQRQHERLLSLVAGTGQLRTWISGLNDLANAAGVRVTQVEPGPLELYVPPLPPPDPSQPPPPAPPGTPPAAAATTDPLLVEGLQKRSATVTLRGSYQDLRRFLERLETLQVIAIASDLDLKQAAAEGTKAAQIELKLKLSAYGRAPAAAPPAAPAAGTPAAAAAPPG
jgi:hypothetical protein